MAESSSLRVIFAGTPTFAARHLQALLASRHRVVAVYTQPDRPAGRGKQLSPSAVKELALAKQLTVMQPASLKIPQAQQALRDFNADIMVVVAYGLILPQAVLDIPRLGCINVHGSLLPRWRGAAPIQRAIAAGDKETGITIMQMDAGLDTGPMLLKVACPISETDTTATLYDRLANLGGPALLTVLDQAGAEQLRPQAQDNSLATYANKIEKCEAQLNWRLSATELQRKIRAFNPMPVAYSELNHQRIKIYQARVVQENVQQSPGTIIEGSEDEIVVACGEQALALTELQMPGKKVLTSAEILRGHRSLFSPGGQFA